MKEGLRRIVKAISAIAWVCLSVGLAVNVVALFGRDPVAGLFVGALGIVSFAVFQAAAWILAGFSGNPKHADGLVRWADLWSWHRHRAVAAVPQSSDPGPTGVGGWLWLPILGLTIFGPLFGLGKTLENIEAAERLHPAITSSAAWGNYKVFAWALVASCCALSIAAGRRLWKDHRPESVALAVWAYWLAGPAALIVDAIGADLLLGIPLPSYFLDASAMGGLLGSAISALIWSLYFRWSRRVRNTYYKRLYPSAPSSSPSIERSEPTL